MRNKLTYHFVIVLIFACALLVEDCSAGPIKKGIKFVVKFPFQVVAAPFQLTHRVVLKPLSHGFIPCRVDCYVKQSDAVTKCRKNVPFWDGVIYEAEDSHCKCCRPTSRKDAVRYTV